MNRTKSVVRTPFAYFALLCTLLLLSSCDTSDSGKPLTFEDHVGLYKYDKPGDILGMPRVELSAKMPNLTYTYQDMMVDNRMIGGAEFRELYDFNPGITDEETYVKMIRLLTYFEVDAGEAAKKLYEAVEHQTQEQYGDGTEGAVEAEASRMWKKDDMQMVLYRRKDFAPGKRKEYIWVALEFTRQP